MASSSSSDSTLEQMITQNQFRPSFSDQLRRLARNDPTLTTLNISYNKIGDTGAALIAQALTSNSSLTKLYLSNNQIGPTGATSIAHNHSHPTLPSLHWISVTIKSNHPR